MTANPYFLYPFASGATGSNVSEIDNTGGTTGPMSYQFGFTPNYEEDLSTIPSALPIPRPEFNQLMLDITTALQILQLQGAPAWVPPATGSPLRGGPPSYPKFARVSHTAAAPFGFQIWTSTRNGNTSEPGVNGDWIVTSTGGGTQSGDYIFSASPNGHAGALLSDGSSYARADYPILFEALTYTVEVVTNGTAVVSVPPAAIAILSGYAPGQGNDSPTWVEGDNVDNGNTYIASVQANTITLSTPASSSGTFTYRFLPYGYGSAGGLTNFGVPNRVRRVGVAAGGSGNTVLGNKIGNTGGADTYTQRLTDMPNHTHLNTALVRSGPPLDPGLTSSVKPVQALDTLTGTVNGRSTVVNDQTDMNIIQSSIIEYVYIAV